MHFRVPFSTLISVGDICPLLKCCPCTSSWIPPQDHLHIMRPSLVVLDSCVALRKLKSRGLERAAAALYRLIMATVKHRTLITSSILSSKVGSHVFYLPIELHSLIVQMSTTRVIRFTRRVVQQNRCQLRCARCHGRAGRMGTRSMAKPLELGPIRPLVTEVGP